MEDKSNPKPNGKRINTPNDSPGSPKKTRAAQTGSSGKARARKPTKKRGLPQQRRVQLAYLLLSVIAASLLLLLALIPDSENPALSRSESSRTEADDQEMPGGQDQPDQPGQPAQKPTQQPTRPAQPGQPDQPEKTEPADEGQGEAQEAPREEKQDAAPEVLTVHPLGDIEPAPPGTGTLYLVIDDVGYNIAQLERYLELPIPMTFALLPGLEHSQSAQERIAGSGSEMILHQPIEPVGDQDPGPGALYVGMQPEEMRRIINRNLDQLPKVIGVNNHMGSRGTADPQLMEALFSVLKGRNLFFLDSRTTAETVAAEIAEKAGLPFSERNVFLDNIEEQIEIEKALKAALELSRRQGYAVMIGHVWSQELASTLALWYAELEEHGYQFARLSSFFAEEHVHAGNGN